MLIGTTSGAVSSTPSTSHSRVAVSVSATDTATRSRSRAVGTPTATDTATVTRSRAVGTPTATGTRSRAAPSSSATDTRSATAGSSASNTFTNTMTASRSTSGSNTPSYTGSLTVTPSLTESFSTTNTPGLIPSVSTSLSQTGTQSVTTTPSANAQLIAAQAANAASNNLGIIIGAASGGLLFGVLVTAGIAYHTATRPRRIASPALYPASHTSMNIPPPYFQEDEEAPPTMIARPRTFSIPPINNQKIPKFTSSRTTFMPTQTQTTTIHNPFEARFHLPPPPPLDD